jgi:hypothetical protein
VLIPINKEFTMNQQFVVLAFGQPPGDYKTSNNCVVYNVDRQSITIAAGSLENHTYATFDEAAARRDEMKGYHPTIDYRIAIIVE